MTRIPAISSYREEVTLLNLLFVCILGVTIYQNNYNIILLVYLICKKEQYATCMAQRDSLTTVYTSCYTTTGPLHGCVVLDEAISGLSGSKGLSLGILHRALQSSKSRRNLLNSV